MYPLTINNYSIIYLPSVDSTNNYTASNEKQSKLQHKTVILTSFQSKGKGQFHNKWQSEKDKNLLLSIYIKPDKLLADQQFAISRIIALAIRDTVSYFLKGVVSIKWPNDIFIGNKKIAGILIENSLNKQWIERSIVGVGLNVNQEEFKGLEASSFKLQSGEEHDLTRILEFLLYRFDQYLEKPIAELHKTYDHHLYLRNEWLMMTSKKFGIFKGRIIGSENNGALHVENEQKEVHLFNHKEIVFS